jgi:hypothetical protein
VIRNLFFRALLAGLGGWLLFLGAQDTFYPVSYRIGGVVVEGEVIGFWAGRGTPSIQPENTALRNGHRIARRPAFKYPAQPGGELELIGKHRTSFTPSFNPYEMGEKVTVVFPTGQPQQAYLFAASSLAGGLGIMAAGLLCLYIGLGGRL